MHSLLSRTVVSWTRTIWISDLIYPQDSPFLPAAINVRDPLQNFKHIYPHFCSQPPRARDNTVAKPTARCS